ncbi:STAS domain-containing protein (plasmid) [Streptomyces sp. BI20]|uniref:STAS domain-containing protein n=1 Tax=Streptomyces sp. BI20 TaxID=3403460 RepID=UPI003C745412
MTGAGVPPGESPGTVETAMVGGVVVARPQGDLDFDTCGGLRRALDEEFADPDARRGVVVDLRRVVFCDSAGLGVLLHARGRAAETGREFSLAGPRGQVERILDTTGTRSLFTVTPGPPE